MASMTDAIYGVDVFGQRDAVAISFTPPEADVLARLYQLVSDFRPAPKPHTIKIKIEGRPVNFVYTAADRRPRWVEPVFRSLASNWGARQGWDSYDAAPTDPNLVVRLLNILSAVMADDARAPQMTPLADGGIQAEWHGTCDLEIVVPSDESPSYYFFNRAIGIEEEAYLDGANSRLQEIIGRLE